MDFSLILKHAPSSVRMNFSGSSIIAMIAPQIKVEVLNHTHSSTKLPPTSSIAPEHQKTTSSVNTKPAAKNKNYCLQNLPPTSTTTDLKYETAKPAASYSQNKFGKNKIFSMETYLKNKTPSDATVMMEMKFLRLFAYLNKILFFSNKFVDPKIYFQDGW